MSFLDQEKIRLQIVRPEALYQVRQAVLRPNLKPEACVFEGDNEEESSHFAAYWENDLVGSLSAIRRNHVAFGDTNAIQFRAMAVLDAFQGKHIGSSLLRFAEKKMMARGEIAFWLNARIKAIPFYESLEYVGEGALFDIPGIGLHQTMFKKITQ